MKRKRNVPNAWWDKSITRLLRKNLSVTEYKMWKCVYLALTEIESDFCHKWLVFNVDGEDIEKLITPPLTKTCAKYAGLSINKTCKIMQSLRDIGLIDYGRNKDDTKFSGSYMVLYEYTKEVQKEAEISIQSYIEAPIATEESPDTYVRSAVSILTYWNEKEGLPTHRPDSQVTRDALQLTEKELKTYTEENVKDAIDMYHSLLIHEKILNPKAPGHRVSLKEFYKFTRKTIERAYNVRAVLPKEGWFRCIVDNKIEQYFERKRPDEQDEQLTKKITELFTDKFRGGLAVKYTIKEQNQFIVAANCLLKFYSKYKVEFIYQVDKFELAGFLIDAIELGYKGFDGALVPGHVCSTHTFNHIFPSWLQEKSVIKGDLEIL